MHPLKLAPDDDPATTTLTPDLRQVLRNGPFPAALHLAIEASGLSLEALQHALFARGIPVSLSTLSYWRRGRSRPERAASLRAVVVMEEVLGLPAGSLAALLGPRRPRGRWLEHVPGTAPLARLWEHPETLARMYGDFTSTPADQLTRLTVTDDYHIGPDGRATRLVSRQVIRAEADRVARCLITLWVEDRTGLGPVLTGTRFCRAGRVRDEPGTGFTVAELVLDRVLGRGELAVVEYELTMPRQGELSDDYSRRFARPAQQYALSVVFDPAAVPVRCHGYQRSVPGGPDRWAAEVWPGSSHTAQFVAHDVPPGLAGLRWEYD
ncbi:transcriptional regulator [Longispora albida]|uniref:transcriptional regulator n=1 Tax=Longispora albida TaxID=203523 RepID=UPI00036A52DB|nr:transcriptional regulator [Longispora albida]